MLLGWFLFAVVMEVIIGVVIFGGTFAAYRVGQRQSADARTTTRARLSPVVAPAAGDEADRPSDRQSDRRAA